MEGIKKIATYKNVDRSAVISLEKGKLPPQAIDCEESLLGSLMIDNKILDEVLNIIKSEEVFYKEQHKYIFKAVVILYKKSSPVDLITVSAELRLLKALDLVGGEYYLIQLTQKILSGAHSSWHAMIILQQFVKREIIKLTSETQYLAYDDSVDTFDLVEDYSKKVDQVNKILNIGTSSKTIGNSLENLKKRLVILSDRRYDEITGLNTGIQRIDEITSGWQNSDLIVIAARPGMGKTSFVLKTSLASLKKNIPVGFISCEMSVDQLTTRLVAIDTDFHLNQLFRTGFDKQEYFETFDAHQKRIEAMPLYFEDSKSELYDIVALCRTWVRSEGVKIIMIDYLQLMNYSEIKGNREQEISTITRRLKLLAKELNVPIILLSQLSRQVETRGSNKRPQLSDLRESGAIEQDADIVAFLYRAEYYQLEVDHDVLDKGGNAEFIIAKHRNGSLDKIAMYWDGNKTKYMDPRELHETSSYNGLPNINPDNAF